MTRHKTPKEMEVLIAKLNKKEIKWDDIDEELKKMRKEEESNAKGKDKVPVK